MAILLGGRTDTDDENFSQGTKQQEERVGMCINNYFDHTPIVVQPERENDVISTSVEQSRGTCSKGQEEKKSIVNEGIKVANLFFYIFLPHFY